MSKGNTIAVGVLLGLMIISVTILLAVGQSVDPLVTFLGQVIVPTVVALWAGTKATEAVKYAKKAEHNTNGRMTELIAALSDQGKTVDTSKYRDILDNTGENID